MNEAIRLLLLCYQKEKLKEREQSNLW